MSATNSSARRTLEQIKVTCDRGAHGYSPLRHVVVVREMDEYSPVPPWGKLCFPDVPTRKCPVIQEDTDIFWMGHFCTDGDLPNHGTTRASRKFDAIAEIIIHALKDARLGTFAIPPKSWCCSERLAAPMWLNEMYQLAWSGRSPLLKAPRWRLHRVIDEPNTPIFLEQLSDEEYAKSLFFDN
jgi:hypothetical protein